MNFGKPKENKKSSRTNGEQGRKQDWGHDFHLGESYPFEPNQLHDYGKEPSRRGFGDPGYRGEDNYRTQEYPRATARLSGIRHPNDYEINRQSSGYGAENFEQSYHSGIGYQESDDSRGEDIWTATNYRGVGPKGYTRSDERIREEACDALESHPQINASQIEVIVKDRVITLSGTVDTRRTKRLAEDTVLDCRGVADVRNLLMIDDLRPSGESLPKEKLENSKVTRDESGLQNNLPK